MEEILENKINSVDLIRTFFNKKIIKIFEKKKIPKKDLYQILYSIIIPVENKLDNNENFDNDKYNLHILKNLKKHNKKLKKKAIKNNSIIKIDSELNFIYDFLSNNDNYNLNIKEFFNSNRKIINDQDSNKYLVNRHFKKDEVLKELEEFYVNNKRKWNKNEIKNLSEKLDLSEIKIYKWNWDKLKVDLKKN